MAEPDVRITADGHVAIVDPDEPDMTTTWPVNFGEVSWSLRYARATDHPMLAATVMDAYAALVDPTISQRDAFAKLKRARRAAAAASRESEADRG